MVVVLLRHVEGVVVDEDREPYARLYAGSRLLRHWGGMRWDDTSGINPAKLTLMARGLAGKLERTKTTGRDKKVHVLPFFVSFGAYVEQKNWLRVWHALLGSHFSEPRDYLLPLPRPDLAGGLRRQALYSDAVGFSRTLLGSLQLPGGGGRVAHFIVRAVL